MRNLSLETELRNEILRQLRKVTPHNCPKVYERLQTQAGYADIEERIIYMVTHEQIVPSACIPQIESELP